MNRTSFSWLDLLTLSSERLSFTIDPKMPNSDVLSLPAHFGITVEG